MRDNDFDIKNPKKKFKKTERVPPKGYDCANDFFEEILFQRLLIQGNVFCGYCFRGKNHSRNYK